MEDLQRSFQALTLASQESVTSKPSKPGRRNLPLWLLRPLPGRKHSLLSLPAEIRNHIYEYALTAPSHLEFSRDAYSLLGGKPVFRLPLQDCQHNEQQKSMFCFANTAAKNTNTAKRQQDKKLGFNTLKFVSKQLYMETAGLEVKYNPLMMTRPMNTKFSFSPTRLLIDFLRPLGTYKLRWLTTITIKHVTDEDPVDCAHLIMPDNFSMLINLSNICMENPHIEVKYILPALSPAQDLFPAPDLDGYPLHIMQCGMFYSMLLYGRAADLWHDPWLRQNLPIARRYARAWKGDLDPGALWCPNLGFFLVELQNGSYEKYFDPYKTEALSSVTKPQWARYESLLKYWSKYGVDH